MDGSTITAMESGLYQITLDAFCSDYIYFQVYLRTNKGAGADRVAGWGCERKDGFIRTRTTKLLHFSVGEGMQIVVATNYFNQRPIMLNSPNKEVELKAFLMFL